ncbi:hypothetical protein IBG34_23155 (plasmid) [Aeromonas media]|nr:hypothetical protein IBG34_23155 [Aeromonas media]
MGISCGNGTKKTTVQTTLKTLCGCVGGAFTPPPLCYKDDVKAYKERSRGLPVAWRDKVASKYAAIFMITMHDQSIPEIRRLNKARFNANSWLREFTKNQSSL